MLVIANFSSLLEVAVALNAMLFIFSISPFIEKKVAEGMESLYENKGKFTFPVAMVSGMTYGSVKDILSKISVIFTLASILLLFVSGIWPEASLPWYLLIPILLMLIFTVPVGSFFVYRFILLLIKHGEQETKEYEGEKLEAKKQ